jgi:WD40 repeat protein
VLAVAGVNETVQLWNVSDSRRPARLGRLTGHVGAVDAVAFGLGGRVIATGGDDKTLRLWDPSNPRDPRELTRVTAHPGRVTSIAFAGDRLLLTGGADGTVALWDMTRSVGGAGESVVPPTEIARLGGKAAVDRVAVGGDGRTVAVGGVDGGLRVLSTDPAVLAGIACGDSRNRISRQTWEQRVPELPYTDPCPG